MRLYATRLANPAQNESDCLQLSVRGRWSKVLKNGCLTWAVASALFPRPAPSAPQFNFPVLQQQKETRQSPRVTDPIGQKHCARRGICLFIFLFRVFSDTNPRPSCVFAHNIYVNRRPLKSQHDRVRARTSVRATSSLRCIKT